MKIKKLKIKILIIACLFGLNSTCLAKPTVLQEADILVKAAATTSSEQLKTQYLKEACERYLKLYQKSPTNIDILVGLSNAYMLLNNNKKAYDYLMQAYNINPDNPKVAAALGDYNYKNEEYIIALEYYKLALLSGYLKNAETNLKTAKCYEKLGDKDNAILYYTIVSALEPSSAAANRGISGINTVEQEKEAVKDKLEKQAIYETKQESFETMDEDLFNTIQQLNLIK